MAIKKLVLIICLTYIVIAFHFAYADTGIDGTATSSSSFTLNGLVSISSLTVNSLNISTITAVSSATISNISVKNIFATTGTIANLVGTTTNNNASPGSIGEYVESAIGNVNFTANDTYQDLTSITLTPGDWDVGGMSECDGNGASWSQAIIGISTVSGNNSSGIVAGQTAATMTKGVQQITLPAGTTLVVPQVRFSLSSTTTVYLKRAWSAVAGGTAQNSASKIWARRVR